MTKKYIRPKYSFWLFAISIFSVSLLAINCNNDFKTRVKEANEKLNAANANPDVFITYDANGATSGTVPADASPYKNGQTATVLGNTGNLVKTGFAFTGWNTTTDGSGPTYATSSSITVTGNTTLFAKWEADTTNPVVGTFISISNETSTSMTVSWGAATDNVTPVSELRYKLVRATPGEAANTVDEIAEIDAKTGADLLLDYTANTTSFQITGLTPDTTYHFAVAVEDGAGFKAVYAPQTGDTRLPEWKHQAYLKAPNTEAGDRFGESVAISGNTIVVSATYEDSSQTTITNGSTLGSEPGTVTDSGAAYVFVRNGTEWNLQAYLKAPNAGVDDWFGYSVSIDGDTIIIATPYEDNNQTTITSGSTITDNNGLSNSGSVYVFVRDGAIWSQQAYLKAPNAEANDNFGNSVAISGDMIVVGAPGESSVQDWIGATASALNGASSSGAAYVFRRNVSTWSLEQYLKADNSEANDQFGYSVSIDGDIVVVGALNEDSGQTFGWAGTDIPNNNSATFAGAAYVYRRVSGTWNSSFMYYLKAPNVGTGGDQFGRSVAVSGNYIIVGAAGEDSNTDDIINGSNLSATNDSGSNTGAAYVYRLNSGNWGHQSYLKAPNVSNEDQFGWSVAISGDTAIVGAPLEDSNQQEPTNNDPITVNDTASEAGAAYVYTRSGTSWELQSYLKASNSGGGDRFGTSVAISGNTIVVGGFWEDNASTTIINDTTVGADSGTANDSGAAYVFVRD